MPGNYEVPGWLRYQCKRMKGATHLFYCELNPCACKCGGMPMDKVCRERSFTTIYIIMDLEPPRLSS